MAILILLYLELINIEYIFIVFFASEIIFASEESKSFCIKSLKKKVESPSVGIYLGFIPSIINTIDNNCKDIKGMNIDKVPHNGIISHCIK